MKTFLVVIDTGRAEPVTTRVEAEDEAEAREIVEEDIENGLKHYTLNSWRIMRIDELLPLSS